MITSSSLYQKKMLYFYFTLLLIDYLLTYLGIWYERPKHKAKLSMDYLLLIVLFFTWFLIQSANGSNLFLSANMQFIDIQTLQLVVSEYLQSKSFKYK